MFRRIFASLFIVTLLTGLIAFSVATADSQGAVKLALCEREKGQDKNVAGFGEEVGWAIANTNDDDQLIVEVHLDDGEPNKTFDVYVKINGKDSWPNPDDQLTTNRKGKGNTHLELNIANYTVLNVQIVLLFDGGKTSGYPGYATDTEEVPLKK